MNEAEALEIMSRAIWAVIMVSAPPILGAMVIGILIALLQALTQIQEMTLTFIPKMLVVMFVLYFSGPFMGGQMHVFSAQLYAKIVDLK